MTPWSAADRTAVRGQPVFIVTGPVGTPADLLAVATGTVEAPVPRPKLSPLSAERFALQLTIDKRTHDKLRYAQTLLSHPVPSGDVAQVLDRALDALIGQLERRKFGSTTKPRPGQRANSRSRHIPAHVRRAVWERDQGQCTFVSDTGHRCSARKFLQFDHIDPVARGGQATVSRMRLRCRAHNQYEAERTFGAGFMSEKREQARRAAAEEQAKDVLAGLRGLGIRGDEALRAVERSTALQGATLEERMRAALMSLRPKGVRIAPVVGAST